MRNQTSFRLTTTLLPTDLVAKTTQVINKVDPDGNKFYPTFTEETVVLTNDDRTIMETARAVCENGVLTFTKRGLSDDSSEEQIENRKLTRNPGSLCFITAGAGDWIDKDDDMTWTGDQTYTGSATYEGALTTKKGVKYPSFATLADLEAYGTPFAGMFAVVEDTGELYRYNANTQTWAMVSNTEAGQYIIRVSDEPPAPGTADNIITIDKTTHSLYVGNSTAIGNKKLDLLLVGGGGGGCGATGEAGAGGGGGGGGVVFKTKYDLAESSIDITIGGGGQAINNGGDSKFGNIIALGGGAGTQNGGNGGGNGGKGYSSDSFLGNGGGIELYERIGNSQDVWTGGQGGSIKNDGTSSRSVNEGARFIIGGKELYVSEGGGGGYFHHEASYSDVNTVAIGDTSSSIGGGGGGGYNTGRRPGQSYISNGTSGKSGIVVVAYPTDGSYGFTQATGGTIETFTYKNKQYKVHTFTTNGTFTIIS